MMPTSVNQSHGKKNKVKIIYSVNAIYLLKIETKKNPEGINMSSNLRNENKQLVSSWF